MNRYYSLFHYHEDKDRATNEVTYKKSEFTLKNEIPYHKVMEEYLKEKGLGERKAIFQGETLFLVGETLLPELNNVFYLNDRLSLSDLEDKEALQEAKEKAEGSITFLNYKDLEEKLKNDEITDCLEVFRKSKAIFVLAGDIKSENFETILDCLESLESELTVFLQKPGSRKEEHLSLLKKGKREILEIPNVENEYFHEVYNAVLESLYSPFEKSEEEEFWKQLLDETERQNKNDYLYEEKIETRVKEWVKRELQKRKSKFLGEFREKNEKQQKKEEEKKLYITDSTDFVGEMNCFDEAYGRNALWVLEEVEFEETIRELPKISFQRFTNLKKIILPRKVKEIPDCYFSGMNNLKEVILPEDLEVVGSSAFQSCRMLEKITIPRKVKEIKDYAFSDCEELKEILLPKSLEKLGNGVFMNTEVKVRLGEDNPNFQIKENMLFSKDGKMLYGFADYEAFCRDYNNVEYELRTEVRGIREYSFFNKCFHKFIVGDGRKEIPAYAFAGIKAMEFQLPKGVEKIKKGAFLKASVKNIIGLENVIELGDKVFAEFDSITDLKKFKSVQKIGKRCFPGLLKPEDFSLPANLVELKDEAFINLKMKKELKFPKTIEKIGLKLFREVNAISLYDKVEIETEIKPSLNGERVTGHKKNFLLLSLMGDDSFKNLKFKLYDNEENLKYEVFFAIQDVRDDIKVKMLSLMDEKMNFDFETYDSLFPHIRSKESRLEMALMRLKKPYNLTEKARKIFEAYVEKMKEKEGELKPFYYRCLGREDLEMLEFLGEYGVISEELWDSLIERCRKDKNIDKMNALMKWKMDFYDMF